MGAIIPIFIPHVGCPHDCVFCNQKKIAGKVSAPTASDVRKIIDEALFKIPNIPEVAFYGGSFTAIPRHEMTEYLSSVKPYIESGRVSGIRLSTRPDAIDEEVLRILESYGVKTIELGVQSMDEEVLKKSGRGHISADAEKSARLILNRGFSLILQMMTHLPASTREKDISTAKKIAELNPNGVRIYPTVVVSDTALCDMWKKGSYIPVTAEAAAELGAEILEIFEEKNIPVIRFGLNPTDDLSAGDALAGAYHPALGEMARSALFYKKLSSLIEKEGVKGKELNVFVARGHISVATGQKRKNIEKLRNEYGFLNIRISEDETLSKSSVRIRQS